MRWVRRRALRVRRERKDKTRKVKTRKVKDRTLKRQRVRHPVLLLRLNFTRAELIESLRHPPWVRRRALRVRRRRKVKTRKVKTRKVKTRKVKDRTLERQRVRHPVLLLRFDSSERGTHRISLPPAWSGPVIDCGVKSKGGRREGARA